MPPFQLRLCALQCRMDDMIEWLSRRPEPTAQRNASILNRRLAGETLVAIAADHSLSVERVRQICVLCERKYKSMRRLEAMRRDAATARQAMEPTVDAALLVPIAELRLPTGVRNKLANDGRFLTLADIVNATNAELLTVPNFGRKNLNMVREAIEAFKS